MRRTAFGGRSSLTITQPLVTYTIIGLCVLAYVAQKLPGSQVTERFEFVPYYAASEPWRLLTAAFLHLEQQPLHILANMYALWLTGPYLEELFGRLRFALLYLICAVGGSIGYLMLANPHSATWFTGTVGASGAVFGLFGAYFIVQRKLNRDTAPLIAVILINFAFGFLPGIAWQVHVGGLLTGLAGAAVLVYAPKANRTAIQFAGLAALGVLLVVLYFLKTAGS